MEHEAVFERTNFYQREEDDLKIMCTYEELS